MPLPKGTHYRIKTYASGKRVRLAIDDYGRVVETKAMLKPKKTRTAKRLASRRRRIGL